MINFLAICLEIIVCWNIPFIQLFLGQMVYVGVFCKMAWVTPGIFLFLFSLLFWLEMEPTCEILFVVSWRSPSSTSVYLTSSWPTSTLCAPYLIKFQLSKFGQGFFKHSGKTQAKNPHKNYQQNLRSFIGWTQLTILRPNSSYFS